MLEFFSVYGLALWEGMESVVAEYGIVSMAYSKSTKTVTVIIGPLERCEN